MVDDARYPVGRVGREDPLTAERRDELISQLEEFPERLREVVEGLDSTILETSYRAGGWTVRQVVHHLADSHLNAYVRFRVAVTSDVPTITPYDEARWAELPDVATVSPQVSLNLLSDLHTRWTAMMRGLPAEAFTCQLYHPEHERRMSLDEMIVTYAWHCRHHLAHVELALENARKSR